MVMTWAPVGTSATNMPGMLGMAKAVESYVNDQGGLNGRKLKVLTCNERNDAVTVIACEKQAADASASPSWDRTARRAALSSPRWRATTSRTSAVTGSPRTSSRA